MSARALDLMAEEVRVWANEHGWTMSITDIDQIGTKLFLVTSELAEAFEHLRDGETVQSHWVTATGKPDGFPVELIDALIRMLHLMGEIQHHRPQISWDRLFREKMDYNQRRAFRHGGKQA